MTKPTTKPHQNPPPSTSASVSVPPTGDAYIDGLLSGVKWSSLSLTYSSPQSASYYSYTGEPQNNFKAITSLQQPWLDKALATYQDLTNLTFTKIDETSTQHATIRYAETDSTSTAWAYYPSSTEKGGDVWFGNSVHYYDNPTLGSYAYEIMLHETGHALGLKHPHEGTVTIPLDKDSVEYTVMSYRSYIGDDVGAYSISNGSYPTTPMMLDIQALQTMYGADYTIHAGDTRYQWSPTTGQEFIDGVAQTKPVANKIFMTVWDGGGQDTYDFSNYTTGVNVDLNPGEWTITSSTQRGNLGNGHVAVGNIANALLFQGNTASLIENATGGSGADTLTGNQADNVLMGGAGDDILDGLSGFDTAKYAGPHADYTWGQNGDGSWFVTSLAEGTDTLRGIEALQFSDASVSLSVIAAPLPDEAPPPHPVDHHHWLL